MWTTKQTNGTKHTADCKRVFGRLDASCPRCKELANGASARKGWNDDKQLAEALQTAAIKAHNFLACPKCGPVCCTCFEW